MRSIRIKICGITRVEDALDAVRLGVHAIGLNFYPKSPRCISVAQAQSILRVLPPFVEPVALFVEEPWGRIGNTLSQLEQVRTVQVHGRPRIVENPAPYRVLVACPIRDRESLQSVDGYLDEIQSQGWSPAAVLVDGHVPGQHGGTGQPAPWQLLADYRCRVPLLLAGGLTPDNVGEAIQRVRPYGVDVASGVESAPGKKDPDKIRRFVEAVREVEMR